jgi:hypothetical protein
LTSNVPLARPAMTVPLSFPGACGAEAAALSDIKTWGQAQNHEAAP